MQSMQRSKSHHWVPQFYMKRWTNLQGRLVSFHRSHDRNLVRQPKPKHIACEDLLYTAFSSEGNHLFGEEEVFKTVDQDGADALDYLLGDDWENTPDDLAQKFNRFIYLLAARHPLVRNQFLESEGSIFAGAREDLSIRDLHASATLEDIRKEYQSPRDRAALLINLLAEFDQTYKELFDNTRRVFVNTRDSAFLVTSDHPFTSAPSIADEKALHYFPLSPQRGIVFTKDNMKLALFRRLKFSEAVSLPEFTDLVVCWRLCPLDISN
jgi:hypothetical protein